MSNVKKNTYIILGIIIFSLVLFLFGKMGVYQVFSDIEAKLYDVRVKIPFAKIEHNPNIVVVTIDDDSLDVLENEFGRWPWNRSAHSEVIKYLEQDGVDLVAFDLMFLGYQKGFEQIDQELAKTIVNNDNIYVAMNFDDRVATASPKLPDSLAVDVKNDSKTINLNNFKLLNCRTIIPEILNHTPNIGIINFKRDDDGISRRAPIVFEYQGKYYPYLAVKLAHDYLKKHNKLSSDSFYINNKNQLEFGDKKIQLDNNGFMNINWYGKEETFTYIPFWKVIKSYDNIKQGKAPLLEKGYFKDKLVFVGVSATSLYDIKSTPTSSVYPGVEIQTTVLNNILNNIPIKKIDFKINLLICFILAGLTVAAVYKIPSPIISSYLTIFLAALYFVAATILFKIHFLWINVFYPILAIAFAYTITYVIKYILKAKDFEYTYKLATTDGLTTLYNHRYFQEQLAKSIETARRYNGNLSLILIDIDFFKKFNDTYGHQAGDAVLRQVAEVLKKEVRNSDLVARYGGEEMAIILANTDKEQAKLAAEKICNAVAEKMFKLPHSVEKNVTISLGVATYPMHGTKNSELIEFADKGLYLAKESGRNQVGSVERVEQGEGMSEKV